jgi:hypothetical protein
VGKIFVSYVGTIQRIYLSRYYFYSDSTLVLGLIHMEFNVLMLCLTLTDGLCCACLCCCRCLEIGTSSIDWAQMNRFYLKAEIKSSPKHCFMRWYQKVPRLLLLLLLLLLLCLGERGWDGKPRSHFHEPIASVCHVTPRCEHALFLHECFFDFVFVFSAMDGKIEQHVCIKFFMNPLLKPLKCFMRLLENIL